MGLIQRVFGGRTPAPAPPPNLTAKAAPRVAAVMAPEAAEEEALPTDALEQFSQLMRGTSKPPVEAIRRRRREVVMTDLEKIAGLPTLGSVAANLKRLLSKEELDIEKVVASIQHDPSLTARVLKVAGTSYYGGGLPVEDLESAVMRLGSDEVRRIATVTKVLDDATRIAPDFDWRCLWQHSVAVGMLAEDLARALGIEAPPLLHATGLLHDIGKVMLAEAYPEEYRQVLTAAYATNGSLAALERDRFGLDHAEAGAAFAERQKFPPQVGAIILSHSDPQAAAEPTVRLAAALIQVGNHFAKAFGLGFSGDRTHLEFEHTDLSGWAVLIEAADPGTRTLLEKNEQFLRVTVKSSVTRIRNVLVEYFAA